MRTQSIGRDDADVFLRQFRGDIASGKLEVFSIGESEFAGAELLVDRYAFASRLRVLDALQLAVALELRNQKLVDHFVAADTILCEVAESPGPRRHRPARGGRLDLSENSRIFHRVIDLHSRREGSGGDPQGSQTLMNRLASWTSKSGMGGSTRVVNDRTPHGVGNHQSHSSFRNSNWTERQRSQRGFLLTESHLRPRFVSAGDRSGKG